MRKGWMGLVLMLAPSVALRAAQPCPVSGEHLHTEGDSGGIAWTTDARRAKVTDSDWCYERRVVLSNPEQDFIDWPLGEIHKEVVVKTWTTRSCCSPQPREESGALEHGLAAARISTKVLRGSGESAQKLAWTSAEGTVFVKEQGTEVRVDVTVSVDVTVGPGANGCNYKILNHGDALALGENSVYLKLFGRAEGSSGNPPIVGKGTTLVERMSFVHRPTITLESVEFRTSQGKLAFRMPVPVCGRGVEP